MALLLKPKNVLYIESISVLPLVIFRKIFGLSNIKVLVHYHEYFSNEEYKKQSFFERLGRKYELKILKRAQWISHTNQDRMDFFKKDFPMLIASKCYIMPNYPSKKWQETDTLREKKLIKEINNPIRLLHIGTLSFAGLYLSKILEHIGNNSRFTLDFYSRNEEENIINRINDYDNIKFKGSIDYNNITNLKATYDVGLVLYKDNDNSLNFKYNAPNKIFEYLALGFDVWCSDKLLTSHNYVIDKTYPKMLLVDFEDLKSFNIPKAIYRKGIDYKRSPYICEIVYDTLLKKIKEDFNH